MTSKQVLIESWCEHAPHHSAGDLGFGPDGALYVSHGDGGSAGYVDYGQTGNFCNDPVNEGGALSSQDLQTPGDPVSGNGCIMRVNPDTGAALPDNPLFGGNPEDDRVIAYGFRNPFRFNIDQTSGNIWVGDVGWNTWEEIDRIISPIDPSVENFGWPCYEGVNRQPGYDAANLPICESLYAAGNSQPPYYQYTTSNNSAITGIVLYRGNNFPVQYRGAIFFTDYTQGWIKVMLPGANGLPDPATVTNFIPTGVFATDLQVGPGGELFYVDVVAGTAHMVKHFAQNAPPTAVAQADVTNGSAPLVVHFDGSASSDPDPGDTLTYAWDLDGDSQFDDASAVNTQYTYTINGTYSAALRVTDTSGAFSTAIVVITVGNAPPSSEF
jgi:glucose/arabinose dehydrogenase